MSSAQPPPPNPVLTAYETFVRETPLVTRYAMSTLVLSWIVSWFVPGASFAIGNIPKFTIFQFEIYRIVLSPLICQSLLTLVFAYLSFVSSGKVMEFSMGSTAFGWLLITIGGVTNVVFLVVCVSFRYVTGEESWLFQSSFGIWTILFGLIAIECVAAPGDSQRRLFFFDVPTIYYPLALLALFSLFGGLNMAYCISTGIGYAYGKGHLDMLKVSQSRFDRWEESVLVNFTRRQGWVVGNAATGAAAWAIEPEGGGGFSFLQRPQQTVGGTETEQGGTIARPPAGGWRAPGSVSPPVATPASNEFPSSGGRKVGGAARRPPNSEARAARLAAAEKRAAGSEENV